MSDVNITISTYSDYEKLKEQVEKLRTELSMRVLERDTLRFVEAKNLEMAYMLALGGLEYRAYKAQCAMLRVKRKLEMMQARWNRQETIDIKAIETALDAELKAYQKTLKEKLETLNQALERSRGEFLTEEEAKEIKRLYRQAVKALHPDLHPDMPSQQLRLFESAVSAYQAGDLPGLRVICEAIGTDTVEESDALDYLMKEHERLTEALRVIDEAIRQILSAFPFTEWELLRHPEQIETRKAALEETIKDFESQSAYYQEQIREYLG